jgi:hypothetical protein
MKRLLAASMALVLAACGEKASLAPIPITDRASHARRFPITAGSAHDAVDCNSCHGAFDTFTVYDCITCHTDPKTTPSHGSVTAYRWASDACYGCHRDGAGVLPANHDTALFPVTGTKHASVGCSQCHGATKQVSDLTCIPCHTQADSAAKHASIPTTVNTQLAGSQTNYQWTSAACVRCHGDGQVNPIASHPVVSHGLQGEGHAPFCITCHPSLRADKTWGADFGTASCLACHTSNNPGG